MLRLHQAMIEMVTDLVKLVSPSPDSSQLKSVVIDVSPTSSPLLSPDSAVWSDYSPPEPSPTPLLLPTKQEVLHLPDKEDLPHVPTKVDVRKQQQLHIKQLVAYIDERAAY